MSDSNEAESAVPGLEERAGGTPGRRAARTCCFCGKEVARDVLDAGGDVGRVHPACFEAWDAEQEALEMSLTMAVALPDPREDLDLAEGVVTVPAAAA